MKRPCSQSCRLCAKYGSAGAWATTHDGRRQHDQADPGRGAAPEHDAQRAREQPCRRASATIACGVLHAQSRCCGLKFSAVDSVIAATPACERADDEHGAARHQPGRSNRKRLIMHGASSRARSTREGSLAADAPTLPPASRSRSSANQPSESTARTSCPRPSCRATLASRTSTWPWPSGTGSRKTTGRSATATTALCRPALRGSNSAVTRRLPALDAAAATCTHTPSAAPASDAQRIGAEIHIRRDALRQEVLRTPSPATAPRRWPTNARPTSAAGASAHRCRTSAPNTSRQPSGT